MRAERRLLEYCHWLQEPGINCLPGSSGTLGRLADEGKDERRRSGLRRVISRRATANRAHGKETRGPRMEIVVHEGESVACPPDGGMGAMIDRMANAIQRDNRCREIAELLHTMPEDHLTTLRCTFIGHWRDVPRTGKTAANMMGIAARTYWRRKTGLLEWLEAKLDIPGRKCA